MEEFVKKMQDEMNVVEKEYLRKLQGDAYHCAAKCCDDLTSSSEQLQRCVEKCTIPVQNADRHVQEELNNLQSRLQRCAMDCGDKIRDRQDLDKLQQRAEAEACVKNCSDEITKLLPAFSKRMTDWFKSKSYLN